MKTKLHARRSQGRRRMVLIILLALVLLPAFATGAWAADHWSDISDQKWVDVYQVTGDQVRTVAEGFTDGTFRPTALVTRAQFAKMAVDGFGLSTQTPGVPTFSDTPATDYFYPWIEGGAASGIIGGYTDGTFRGKQTISRQQANSMVGLYLSQEELNSTGFIRGENGWYTSLGEWYLNEGVQLLNGFVDGDKVAAAHAQATAYLVARGVVKGSELSAAAASPRYLHPQSSLTRAQAAAMIIRARGVTFTAPPVLHLSVTGIPDPVTAGAASNVTVTVLDDSNNVLTGYAGTVHFTSTDAQAGLPADYTFTAVDAGTHTFANGVVLKTLGSQTVTATDTAAAAITGSQTVVVKAPSTPGPGGVVSLYRFVVAPGLSPAVAGVPFDVSVAIVDSLNNLYTGFTGKITFTSTDPLATLPAPYTFTGADAGVRAFDDAIVLRTAGPQTITVRDVSGLIVGTLTVNVLPGAPSQLRIETAANGSGTEITAPTLSAGAGLIAYAITRDVYGNFVANVPATWALINITGTVVAGDLVPSADGKSAVFSAHLAGTGVINAVAGALTDNTGIITVTKGMASRLSIETAPDGSGTVVGNVTVGVGENLPVFAIARDAGGNFLANVSSSWSVINKTLGVVDGDLMVAADGKSAVFYGHLVGTGVVRAISGGLSDITGTITVLVLNIPPVLDPITTPQAVNELANLTFTATASDVDIPAQTLTFSLVGAPAGATIDPSTGAFSWTPTEAQGPQSHIFTVQVSDGIGSDTQAVTVNVAEVNVPPSLDLIPNQTANELVLLTFTATTTDPDLPANPLAYSLTGVVPPGAAITTGGVFTWTPDESQGGSTFTVTVQVSDGTATDTQDVQITVNETNSAPVIGDLTVTIPELAAYNVSTGGTDSDIPVQTLSWSLVGAPAGASIDPTTGAFSWTPTEDQGGTGVPFTFSIQLSDGTVTTTATATITVTEVNVNPVLATIGNQTVNELALLTFNANSTDDDLPAQTRTYSLTGVVPPGASIVAATGVFTWTPTEAQGPGSYPVTVQVSDGVGGTDSETFTVTVDEVNLAPVLGAIADQTIPEQALFSFTASATDGDVPANTLAYSLIAEPAGALIDPTTGVFTWTPVEAQGPGVYPFTVQVSDGAGGTDSQLVTLTVTEANGPPVLAPIVTPQAHDELTPISFTVLATDTDLPAQTVTYNLIGAPTGASIDPNTGAFSWTPTEAQGGTGVPVVVTFQATDSLGLSDTQDVTFNIGEVNLAPVLGVLPVSTIVAELVEATFTATATDADLPAQALTFSLVGAPAGATIDPTTGAFSWTPTEAQGPGIYGFNVMVADVYGAMHMLGTSVTVNETNSAPVIGDLTVTIPELAAYNVSTGGTDSDIPVQTLSWSLVGAPAGASIDPTTGAFSWTPTEDQGGTGVPFTFSIQLSDGTVTTTATATITVTEVNVNPVLATIGNQTVNELALLTFTALGTDTDVPTQTLTYGLTGVVPLGASIVAATGVFTWTPTEAQGPGSYPVTVQVTDSLGGTDSETFTITVNEVNLAPVLGAIADQTIPEQALFSFTASATDGDVPANTLAYSLIAEPAGALIDPTTGVFTWTPVEAQGPGVYPFTVQVSDGAGGTDSQLVTLTVTEANGLPVLAAIGEQTVNELVLLTFTASASDTDVPAQTLTYSLIGPPLGATIDPATGVFTWTPTEAQGPADYSFSVQVSDGVGGTDIEDITVHVLEANVAPVLGAIGNKAATELSLLTFTATATDSDLPTQTLAFSLANPASGSFPTGATIGSSSGVFSWTPTLAQGPGTYRVQVVVSDGVTTTSEEIEITVAPLPPQQVFGVVYGTVLPTGLAGATVTVSTDYNATIVLGTATTDASGNFTVDMTGIATGTTIYVKAISAGYQEIHVWGTFDQANEEVNFTTFGVVGDPGFEDRRLPPAGPIPPTPLFDGLLPD